MTRTFHRWLLFRILFLFFFFERMKSLKHSFEKELGENSCESIDRAQGVGYLILLLKTSHISLLRGATTYAIRSPKTWPTFQPIRKRIGKPTPVQLDHETPYFDIPRFKIPRLCFFHDSWSCLDDRTSKLPSKVEEEKGSKSCISREFFFFFSFEKGRSSLIRYITSKKFESHPRKRRFVPSR